MSDGLDALRAIGPRPVLQITPPADAAHELLSDPAGPVAPGRYPMPDHGGGVARAPRLQPIFMGDDPDRAMLEPFFAALFANGLHDCLVQSYGVGQGVALPSVVVAGYPWGTTLRDTDIQARVVSLIAQGLVPQPTADTIHMVFLPSGVTITSSGQASCAAWCGTHDATPARIAVSIQPADDCQACHGPDFTEQEARTAVCWHEWAEACTDFVPGQGHYNDESGMECCDPTAWQKVTAGPYAVQPIVGPNGEIITPQWHDSQPAPQPEPQPQPQPQPQPEPKPDPEAQFWAYWSAAGDEASAQHDIARLAEQQTVLSEWLPYLAALHTAGAPGAAPSVPEAPR